jgi:hypothetical protein
MDAANNYNRKLGFLPKEASEVKHKIFNSLLLL